MEKHYYLGLVASPELTEKADQLLAVHAQGGNEPYAPLMLDLVNCFVPELMNGLMMDSARVVGLSDRSLKILNGATETINKAINILVNKLLKKRSNGELRPLIGYVEDIYLCAEHCSNGRNSVGCRIDQGLREELLFLIEQVREGKTEQYRKRIDALMFSIVDAFIDGFMLNAIERMQMNYVVRKICDTSVTTCRKTGYFIVNKIFKRLSQQQFVDLGVFFVTLMLTVQR